MSNLTNLVSAYAGSKQPHDAILSQQLVSKGMPPLTLPHLRAPSGACIQSPQFGYADWPIQALVLRYEHHERLIAEAAAGVRGESMVGDSTTLTSATEEAVH
jgi:hypothetical protein